MGTTSSKSTIANVWNKILTVWKNRPGKGEIKSFREKQKSEEAVDQRDLGIKGVSVEKIVGSVGRYNDFDNKFRLKEDHEPYRLKRIKEAMRMMKPLPPVELFKIKDEYYVLDGNHRVAAAKEFDQTIMDAHIIEYLSSKDTLGNILYREKADFEWKTGLTDSIKLTEVGRYAKLMEQILEHQHSMEELAEEPVSLKSAAEDWYRTIYLPMVGIIKQSGLVKAFPKRTLTDLYSYISFYQWKKGRKKRKYNGGIDVQIPKSMERFRAKMMEKKEFELPGMKRTATAFLMISVETRRENRIMERLFAFKEVQEIHFVPGDFDIIAKIVVERDLIASDSEVIGDFIQNRVRRIPGVVKTKTIIPISSKIKKDHSNISP